ncbi:MAG: HAD hydrolase-like protein [Kiritimatiellia bacterium]
MKNIKQLFMDLDGPLLDGKERHYHCYRSILEKLQLEPIGMNEYWEKKRALLNRRDLLRLSGAEQHYNDFLVSWMAMIESPEALALDRVQEGALDCLDGWQAQGIELTLVTMRSNRTALEQQLSRLKLRPLLDAVLVCAHTGGGKGKAETVRSMYPTRAFKKQALWIGDTEADWEAAKDLGCDVVLLSNGLRNTECLASLGSGLVMPSIASLKGKVLEELDVH